MSEERSGEHKVRFEAHQVGALALAYRAGNPINELAAQFGIHRATVTAILNRLGVEPRQRGLG
jgi:DNA-binding MarR family transcriptional regulator